MIKVLALLFWLAVLAVLATAGVIMGMIALGVVIYRRTHPRPVATEAPKVVYFVAVDERGQYH